MAHEVTIKTTEPVTVAYIPMTGPFSLINQTFGRLFSWIGENGYTPAGPAMGVYFDDPAQVKPENLTWELRVPLSTERDPAAPDASGVGIKTVPPIVVASATYKGPYEKIGPVYGEIAEWIMGNGYQIIGPPQEVYLNDPATTSPDELLTELRFPVQKG